jgi:N12 class adenine-specific DNA methylase
MIVGKMEMVSGPFGMESTCVPDESRPFEEQLREAISNIHAEYEAVELSADELGKSDLEVIPADPNVKNYSFCMVDDHVILSISLYTFFSRMFELCSIL